MEKFTKFWGNGIQICKKRRIYVSRCTQNISLKQSQPASWWEKNWALSGGKPWLIVACWQTLPHMTTEDLNSQWLHWSEAGILIIYHPTIFLPSTEKAISSNTFPFKDSSLLEIFPFQQFPICSQPSYLLKSTVYFIYLFIAVNIFIQYIRFSIWIQHPIWSC